MLFFLEKGGDAWLNSDQASMLDIAVRDGLGDKLVDWLRSRGHSIDREEQSTGATLLHYVAKHAAIQDSVEDVISCVLTHGASPHATDIQGKTPIDYAISAAEQEQQEGPGRVARWLQMPGEAPPITCNSPMTFMYDSDQEHDFSSLDED